MLTLAPPGTTNRASFITLVTSISVTGSGSTAQAAEDDADQKFEDELESIGSDLRSSVRSAHDAYHDDVGTNGDPGSINFMLLACLSINFLVCYE